MIPIRILLTPRRLREETRPRQAVSHAAEYADANPAPAHRVKWLPQTDYLSDQCCR